MLSQWCALDLGRALSQVWVAPLDLGSTPDRWAGWRGRSGRAPRSRACHSPISRARLPSWPPVGASGGRASTAFPRDSSRFDENDSDP